MSLPDPEVHRRPLDRYPEAIGAQAGKLGYREFLVLECELHAEAMTTEELLASLYRNGGHFEVVHIDSNPAWSGDVITLRRVAAAAPLD